MKDKIVQPPLQKKQRYIDFGAGHFVSERFAQKPDEPRYILDDATQKMIPEPKKEVNDE